MRLLLALGLFIGFFVLIIGVLAETGIYTTILITITSVYTVISSQGNYLFAKKLHDITKNINDAIRLIQQRLK